MKQGMAARRIGRAPVLALLGIAALLAPGAPARGEVESLTLGITMNCPYGLGG